MRGSLMRGYVMEYKIKDTTGVTVRGARIVRLDDREARRERNATGQAGPRPATPIDRENDYRSAPVSPAVARSTSDRS